MKEYFTSGTHLFDTYEFCQIKPVLQENSYINRVCVNNSLLSSPAEAEIISINQLNNKTIQLIINIPNKDVNGNNISGVSKLTVATIIGSENIFSNKSMEEILQIPGVFLKTIQLSENDIGTQKIIDMPLLGLLTNQVFAVSCRD